MRRSAGQYVGRSSRLGYANRCRKSTVADGGSEDRFDVDDRFDLFPPVRKGRRTELARLHMAAMTEGTTSRRVEVRVPLLVLSAIAERAWRRVKPSHLSDFMSSLPLYEGETAIASRLNNLTMAIGESIKHAVGLGETSKFHCLIFLSWSPQLQQALAIDQRFWKSESDLTDML